MTARIALSGDPEADQWFPLLCPRHRHERTDDWPAAEADFRMALDLNPGQPSVLNYLGYSLVEKRSGP
jgi:Tfp pilus assembly protein PilF